MKLSRLVIFAVLLVFVMSVGAVSAQDGGVTMIIGWEQEPDVPAPLSPSAFAAYTDDFYGRDVWNWRGEEREIYPIMVEEVPSVDNGLVETVPVTGDFDGDGTEEDGEAPVVTYKLRPGMLWSDGQPVTAEDCMFYHNLMMEPDPVDSFQRGLYPDVVETAEMVDELTVKVTYNTPFPDFTSEDGRLSCQFPAHKFLGENGEGFTMDADGDGVFDANIDDSPYFRAFASIDPAELVGYGPYVLESFNAGQNMTFVRNANWGVNDFETAPTIDTFILQFIPESAQMENAMSVGDIDLAFNFLAADNGYDEMENVGTFVVPGVFVDALWINSGPQAFAAMQDVSVREALVHAIDRRSISNQFAGEGTGDTLPTSWYPPQFTNPELGFREYDVELARTMLTEAGWVDADGDEGTTDAPTARVSQGVEGLEDGTPLVLRFYTTPVTPRPDVQTVIQGYLTQVGIATQLFVVDGPTALFATFANRGILNTGSYDIALYALSNDPLSPNGSREYLQCRGIPSAENPEGQNSTWFCNEEYDRLDNLVAVTIDPEERLELGYQRDPLHYEAAVWHSIRTRPTAYAVRTDRFDIASISVGTLSNNYFQSVENWQPVQ
jgi:peptide/nickel transport system substrate-binding protein